MKRIKDTSCPIGYTGGKSEEKKMKKYYYSCPRGFANEFQIISVDMKSPYERDLLNLLKSQYQNSNNINWDLHSITAKRAHNIISAERQTKRHYEKIGLNLTNNPVGATEITTISEYYAERGYY